MKSKFLLALAVLIFPNFYTANADSVKLLATLRVTPSLHKFFVPVKVCGDNISALKLRITGASVYISDFGLRFSDRSEKPYPVNLTFPGNNESQWIDFSGFRSNEPRCITSVYANARSEGGPSSKVEIFGNLRN